MMEYAQPVRPADVIAPPEEASALKIVKGRKTYEYGEKCTIIFILAQNMEEDFVSFRKTVCPLCLPGKGYSVIIRMQYFPEQYIGFKIPVGIGSPSLLTGFSKTARIYQEAARQAD